jgi:hypothetical protein
LKDFDARRLVRSIVAVGADTLRFAGIAYWACYPSKSFRVHPELGNRDLLNEVSAECQANAIHLYAYTGYGHPHMEIGWVDDHPNYAGWVLRGPDDKPYGAYPHAWGLRQRLCITGKPYRQGIRQVVRELCEHDVEGVYLDGPAGYRGICFCDECRATFKAFSGIDLDRLADFVRKHASNGLPSRWSGPIPPDTDIEALTAWYDWANELERQDLLDFRQIIHGSGKFMLCHNGASWAGTSLFEQYRVPDGFMEEASIQTYQRLVTGMMGGAMARPYGKVSQMYLGSYAVNWFGQPPHDVPWTSNDTNIEDGDEVVLEGMTDLACGNMPLYCTANRLYYGFGSGSTAPVKEIFQMMEKAEPILKDSLPVSYVSIVPTWESLQLWRSKRYSWNMNMAEGLVLAMLENHISVDMAPSTELAPDWLNQQKVIALCGASALSDAQAEMLRAWVNSGGGLLATYDTGLYDDRGRVRSDGGALREVLGVDLKDEPLEPQPDCYYRIRRAHPALAGYEPDTAVQADLRLVPAAAHGAATVLADCWNLGTTESRGPAIIANQYGKGRTIYIAGSLEAFYVSTRIESIRRILAATVSYLAGDAPKPFTLSAPAGVYGILRKASNSDPILWVLANVGFKDATAGRMRQEFLSVPDISASVLVPEGRHLRSVRLIRANRTIPATTKDGYARFSLPPVHIGEVIHLELS